MYFNYWWDTNYILKALILTLSLIILLFITFLIIFSALKKLKQETKEKIIIPENIDWQELFEYLTTKLNLTNSYVLAKFLNQDYNSIQKLIKEKNYKILNKLIISEYEKR